MKHSADPPIVTREKTANMPLLFDRQVQHLLRERIASNFRDYDFLLQEVTARLIDRLEDVRRNFPIACILGGFTGQMTHALKGQFGVQHLLALDSSKQMQLYAGADAQAIIADEEFLPLRDASLDLLISPMVLHRVNDLPGVLAQIRRALKPDGFFLAMFPGGETLKELRHSLMQAEMELSGGASPRVMPFLDIHEGGALLQRAGFALPIIDRDQVIVTYDNLFKLMKDLRGMGETNALHERSRSIPSRLLFMRAAEIYQQEFAGENGKIPATFELVTLAGWVPAPGQPKALERGTGQINLKEIL